MEQRSYHPARQLVLLGQPLFKHKQPLSRRKQPISKHKHYLAAQCAHYATRQRSSNCRGHL